MFTVLLSFAASLSYPSFPSPLSFQRRREGPTPRRLVVFFSSPAEGRKRAWSYSNRTRMISPNFQLQKCGERKGEMICFSLFLMTGARKKHFAVSSLNEPRAFIRGGLAHRKARSKMWGEDFPTFSYISFGFF